VKIAKNNQDVPLFFIPSVVLFHKTFVALSLPTSNDTSETFGTCSSWAPLSFNNVKMVGFCYKFHELFLQQSYFHELFQVLMEF
jgi:hypothetical protein